MADISGPQLLMNDTSAADPRQSQDGGFTLPVGSVVKDGLNYAGISWII